MSTPPSTDRSRPRWPSAASLLLAALVAGFLLVTPRAPLGTTGLWTGTTVGSGAAWDVVLLLARVSVVAAVLVSRRRPSWALALALWPYLLWPVIGYFEWGWWLGLLCVAVLVAYDSVRGAAWPVVAVLAVAATYAATGVWGDTFAMLPIGQVSAVSPG
ncbi:MAG: hypothetical protein HGA44_23360, partial [Cellulomonadaceae bacterium]|nr:hypothetical protein [Cellulomonadaceae bacterium]